MAFTPKKVKYRKMMRGHKQGLSVQGSQVSFGEYGLKAVEAGNITNNQLEMIRVILARALRRSGKSWMRVFSDKPITRKPQEVRMGKGKGDLDHWEAVVRRGRIMFEISGVPRDYAQGIFRKIAYKLPFKCKMVERI